MTAAVRRLVRERANERCEYCRLLQSASPFLTFRVEHIIARQHVDDDRESNLCSVNRFGRITFSSMTA